jgi:hypothetical protein
LTHLEPLKNQAAILGGRTTKLTPAAVTTIPASVTKVMGSLNNTHAIMAVVGGTKYNRLVTDAAAPR